MWYTYSMRREHTKKQVNKTGLRGKKDVWYKLDLSATVYPTLQRRDFSSVYRLSVKLKEPIDPALLQQALDLTLPRFPTYKVAIRKGLFWRYLEPNNRPGPFVQEDIKNPCMPMHFRSNNRYLIRIYHYGWPYLPGSAPLSRRRHRRHEPFTDADSRIPGASGT